MVRLSKEEALEILTETAEEFENNKQPLSISAFNEQGLFQTFTLFPLSTNDDEKEYTLVVTNDQKNDMCDKENQNPAKSVAEVLQNLKNEYLDEEQLRQIRLILPQKRGPKFKVENLHKLDELDYKNFHCPQCNFKTNIRNVYNKHSMTHISQKVFRCQICDKLFKSAVSLKQHIDGHEGRKPFKCSNCTWAFLTKGELERHIRYKHTHEKPHKCTECSYSSVEFAKLRRHMQAHIGFKPYNCHYCSYRAVDNFKLKRHLRIHTGERPYVCDICSKAFNQRGTLNFHKFIHTKKPKFKCNLCPIACSRKTDLRAHFQALHNSDIPVLCKKCGKFFPDKYSLTQHNISHGDEKCFKCELCEYASKCEQHLKSHVLVHMCEKFNECTFCGKKYRQKFQLKRHIETIHSVPCIRKRIKKMTDEKIESCQFCRKNFKSTKRLLTHLEKFHKATISNDLLILNNKDVWKINENNTLPPLDLVNSGQHESIIDESVKDLNRFTDFNLDYY